MELRVEEDLFSLGSGDSNFAFGCGGLSLSALLLFVLSLFGLHGSDSFFEVVLALGSAKVLDSDVDSLVNNSISDLFVDDDTDGAGVDVENSAGSAVIVFVGHAFVNGTIANDVDEVSLLVDGHVSGEFGGSVLSEGSLEQVSSFSSISVGVWH